jgi:hypothetical protein
VVDIIIQKYRGKIIPHYENEGVINRLVIARESATEAISQKFHELASP